MMELNRNAEVSLHGQAADMEWTLNRIKTNNWLMIIEAVSEINLAAGDTGKAEEQAIPRIRKQFNLTDKQASATLALFIGEIEDDQNLNHQLYSIAEEVWGTVEQYFRPIP